MENTSAYLAFKKRTQEIFDFAVLVTLSVPVLKHNINLLKASKISRIQDPDYFEPSVIYHLSPSALQTLEESNIDKSKVEQLRALQGVDLNNKEFKEKVIAIIGDEEYKKHRNVLKKQSPVYIDNIIGCTSNYQSKLATYLYFSTFSYFEAYISDVSSEISRRFDKVDFEQYLNAHHANEELTKLRVSLNKPFDGRKKDKYTKLSKQLISQCYKTPEELFFSSMINLFEGKMKELKANEIPDFLERYLLYKMPADEISMFGVIRGNRNSIGHGQTAYIPSLKDVIDANKYFKKLASNIDRHLTFHFFSLSNFNTED